MSLRPSERVSYGMLFVMAFGTFGAVFLTSQMRKLGAIQQRQTSAFEERLNIFNKKE